MEPQERAFTAWLNNVLDPPGDDATRGSMAVQRSTARVRGLLYRLYSQDEGVIATMARLEQHIDDGFLCMRDPVRPILICTSIVA